MSITKNNTRMLEGTLGVDKLSATGTKDATTFLRGDNTFAAPAAPSAGNSPTFSVRLSTDQSVPSQSTTKLAFATEDWDTDSAWDTTNYNFTVPSGQAGRYCFNGHVRISQIWGHPSTSYFSQLSIRVNNDNKAEHRIYDYSATTKDLDLQVSKVLNLSVGDVVDFRVYHNGAGQQNQNIASGAAHTWFTGFKLA